MTVALVRLDQADDQSLPPNIGVRANLATVMSNTDMTVFDTEIPGQITVKVACKCRVTAGVGMSAGRSIAGRAAWLQVGGIPTIFGASADYITPQYSFTGNLGFAANDVLALWAYCGAFGVLAKAATTRGPETFLTVVRLDTPTLRAPGGSS